MKSLNAVFHNTLLVLHFHTYYLQTGLDKTLIYEPRNQDGKERIFQQNWKISLNNLTATRLSLHFNIVNKLGPSRLESQTNPVS